MFAGGITMFALLKLGNMFANVEVVQFIDTMILPNTD